ncbi:hypothetical protein HY029_06160 [Candidatus Gottesmanbacteria bacterium]|nr:hypothetical protein [Candidatus Gottesmanbacteria bacterium]
MKYIAYLILAATIIFNLWLNYPETQILADPNDNIFQFSLVGRTNWVWENYGCPLSLSCLPNLIDHNVTNWAEGYPLPFYYSHIPQITIVSSYHLFIKPISSIFNSQFSIYNYYNWTKYLLLSLFPLSVFLALRIVGFSPILAALGAFFSAHYSTDGLYGIDPPSYLWRGYGLTSQLYALIFLPLGIAFTYRALIGDESSSKDYKLWNKYTLKSIIFLTLTVMGHLGIGIIGFLSTIPFIFLDLNLSQIINRGKKLFFILASCFLILSYWIIPILLNNQYHIISFWDPIWKFNSYGWYEVARQLFAGEIFDWQRFPIVTILVLAGFFVLTIRRKYFPFSLLFAFWMILYFGRTTWGGLIDLIPGMKDFHQHRFIVGVHIAALFLIPAGLEYLFSFISKIKYKISKLLTVGGAKEGLPNVVPLSGTKLGYFRGRTRADEKFGIEAVNPNLNIVFYILLFIFASFLIYITTKQTADYATLNNKWIYQANDAYRYDEHNFQNLLAKIDSLPRGRIYAGRPGNWGKNFRLGSTELYLLFGGIGYDISQFLPETWSPLSENEQDFDEREALDFDLLNIKYAVAAKNEGFASSLKLVDKYGPFNLFQAPTTGWFDVVTSPMMVKSDKTNYLNLVHYWWNSYTRRWKMHPLISVENNPTIPQNMQRVLTMTDETNYIENGQSKNIFADFPLMFPESTPSGKIIKDNQSKQTFSATIEVPNNCKYCYAMFKMSYHPDWKVKLDGNEASKFAVFPFYLATPVTPGTHTVEFTYEPNKLKVFLLAGEIILGIIFIIFRKKIS